MLISDCTSPCTFKMLRYIFTVSHPICDPGGSIPTNGDPSGFIVSHRQFGEKPLCVNRSEFNGNCSTSLTGLGAFMTVELEIIKILQMQLTESSQCPGNWTQNPGSRKRCSTDRTGVLGLEFTAEGNPNADNGFLMKYSSGMQNMFVRADLPSVCNRVCTHL